MPFASVGVDFQQLLAQHRAQLDHDNPLSAIRLMNRVMPEVLRAEWQSLLPLLQGQQLVVAGGAALSARSAVESARLPFRYVAYTPQLLPSAWHPPFMIPLTRSPRWFNRLGWWGMGAVYDRLLLPVLNELRRGQGLPALADIMHQVFPTEPGTVLLAADPEVAPAPPDLSVHQVGAFHLADPRPLPAEVERFLAGGEPPVYIGFGSMPDAAPERTSAVLAEATRRAGCRVLLSSGWAGLGAERLGSHVQMVGPLAHGALFPRLAGIVHHGGAGTTAASTRAGVPQLVVPHMLDQFMNAHSVRTAGIGLSLSRSRLGVERLARALVRLREDAGMRTRAARVGEQVRARNSLAAAVALLEQAAAEGLTPRASP